MATLRLGTYELDRYELPATCAKCGEKAVVAPARRFAWSPPWLVVLILLGLLGVILYIILALSLSKRRTVPLPFCERHRNYWLNRKIFYIGGFLAVLLLGILAIVLGVMMDDRGMTESAGAYAGVGMAAVFLIWLISAAVVQATSIKTTEITDNAISLTGLSREFVNDVDEARRGDERDEDEEEDDRPRPRRRPRDDDDGGYSGRGEGRPRRRPPPDAIEEGDER